MFSEFFRDFPDWIQRFVFSDGHFNYAGVTSAVICCSVLSILLRSGYHKFFRIGVLFQNSASVWFCVQNSDSGHWTGRFGHLVGGNSFQGRAGRQGLFVQLFTVRLLALLAAGGRGVVSASACLGSEIWVMPSGRKCKGLFRFSFISFIGTFWGFSMWYLCWGIIRRALLYWFSLYW